MRTSVEDERLSNNKILSAILAEDCTRTFVVKQSDRSLDDGCEQR